MPTPQRKRRKTRGNPQFATREELRSILDVIDKNTARISRPEDLFALEFQQRGCPFLELVVRPADDQIHWLDLEGDAGVKELLRAEFEALRAPNAPAR